MVLTINYNMATVKKNVIIFNQNSSFNRYIFIIITINIKEDKNQDFIINLISSEIVNDITKGIIAKIVSNSYFISLENRQNKVYVYQFISNFCTIGIRLKDHLVICIFISVIFLAFFTNVV